MRKDVYIVDGLRTPIGGAGKSLKGISAVDLGSTVIKAIAEKHRIADTSIDEVIMGNAVSAGLGQNPARLSAVGAGLSPEIPGFTVNKVCGSGLKSVILGAQSIMCEDAALVLSGGMESASQCPKLDSGEDSLIHDGLWCGMSDVHMGMLAEFIAEKLNISREEQDTYAMRSQMKAVKAVEDGMFNGEIVPVKLKDGSSFSIDEKPRKGTDMKKLARLPAAFKPDGTVTAGNSPAPADGAAALILSSEKALKENDLSPVARIISYATAAVDPKLVFTSAPLAAQKCMEKGGLKMKDIDLFEINEAFAVQMVHTIKTMDMDPERVNIFGGTIALGHPLGASGARGLVTLINALRVKNKKVGITSVCLGGGCAVALAVEMT